MTTSAERPAEEANWVEPERFYPSLPKAHTAAGAFITDASGRALIVKQAYADRAWVFPGGWTDPGERPDQALRRELSEELELDRVPGPLLVVDWNAPAGHRRDPLVYFVFDCGHLAGLEHLRLQDGEVDQVRFIEPAIAGQFMEAAIAARMRAAAKARAARTTIYLPFEPAG